MNYLLDILFTGFGVYSVFYVLAPSFWKEVVEKRFEGLDVIACRTFTVLGVMFIVDFGYQAYVQLNLSENENYMLWNRWTGPYAYFYWGRVIQFTLIPLLFWIKRIQRVKWLRVVIGICMLIAPEKLIIFFSSLHRGNLPASWQMLRFDYFLNWPVDLIVFLGVVFILRFAMGRIKKRLV